MAITYTIPYRRNKVMSKKEEKKDLKKMKAELEELKKSRSKATCSTTVSMKTDVDRETRIEELEEAIAKAKAEAED